MDNENLYDIAAVPDVIVVHKNRGITSKHSAPSIPYKYTRAQNKGATLLKWEEYCGKPVTEWSEQYLATWKTKYFEFMNLLVNIESDYSRGNIPDDVYSALLHYKELANELLGKATERNPLPQNKAPRDNLKHGAWDEKEDELLKISYSHGDSVQLIAEKLNRTEKAVCFRLANFFPEFHNPYEEETTPSKQKVAPTSKLMGNLQEEFDYFCEQIKEMPIGNVFGTPAPHKAIMLLTIRDFCWANLKYINKAFIPLSYVLENYFKQTWRSHVHDAAFLCDMAKPFFHLQSSQFWKLVPKTDLEVSLQREPSLQRLIAYYSGANVDKHFLNVLVNRSIEEDISRCLLYLLEHGNIDGLDQSLTHNLVSIPMSNKSVNAISAKSDKPLTSFEMAKTVLHFDDFEDCHKFITRSILSYLSASPTDSTVQFVKNKEEYEFGWINLKVKCMPFVLIYIPRPQDQYDIEVYTSRWMTYPERFASEFDFDKLCETLEI